MNRRTFFGALCAPFALAAGLWPRRRVRDLAPTTWTVNYPGCITITGDWNMPNQMVRVTYADGTVQSWGPDGVVYLTREDRMAMRNPFEQEPAP